MFRQTCDGRFRCLVKMRDRKRRRYAAGALAEQYANQLERGQQIRNASDHHTGMAALLARLGRPRPPGLELSLVDFDGPGSYWGNSHRKPYRLSTNPEAYTWETRAENVARSRHQR
jgi:hypothetical protein